MAQCFEIRAFETLIVCDGDFEGDLDGVDVVGIFVGDVVGIIIVLDQFVVKHQIQIIY